MCWKVSAKMDIVHIEVKGEPFIFPDSLNENYATCSTDQGAVIKEENENSDSYIDPPDVCKTLLDVVGLNKFDINTQQHNSVPVRQYRNNRRYSVQSDRKQMCIKNGPIKVENYQNVHKLSLGNLSQQHMSSLSIKENNIIDLPLPEQEQCNETYVLERCLKLPKSLSSRYNEQGHESSFKQNQKVCITRTSHTSKQKRYSVTHKSENILKSKKLAIFVSNSTQHNSQCKSSVCEIKKEENILRLSTPKQCSSCSEICGSRQNSSFGTSLVSCNHCKSDHQICESPVPIMQNEDMFILHSPSQKQCSTCNEAFELEQDFTLHKMSCNHFNLSQGGIQDCTSPVSVKEDSDVTLALHSSREKECPSCNKTFVSEQQFNLHKKSCTHSNLSQTGLQHCTFSASVKQDSDVTLVLHCSREKECPSCNETFESEQDFTLHKMSCNHSNLSHAGLQHCTSPVSVKKDSDVTLALHSSREKECPSCNETFVSERHFNLHKNSCTHSNLSQTGLQHCTFSASVKQDSDVTLVLHSSREKECPSSNETFVSDQQFNLHKKSCTQLRVKHQQKNPVKQYKNKKRKNLGLNHTKENTAMESFTDISVLDTNNKNTSSIDLLEVKPLDCVEESLFKFDFLSCEKTDAKQGCEKNDSSVQVAQEKENRVVLASLEQMHCDSGNKMSPVENDFDLAEMYSANYNDSLVPRKQDLGGTLVLSALENSHCSSNDETVVSQNNTTLHINQCENIEQQSQNNILLSNVSGRLLVFYPLKKKQNEGSFNQEAKFIPRNTLRGLLKSFSNDMTKLKQLDKKKSRNGEPSKKKGSQAKRKHKVYYYCIKCNKQFRGAYSFKRHSRRHENEGNFKCNKCKKIFKKLSIFERHLTVTDCEKIHKCKRCHKKFSSYKELTEHLNFVEEGQCIPSEEWEYYYCSTCRKGFTDKEKLKDHVQTHTGVTLNCPICGSFIKKSYIREHMKKHTRTKSTQCHLCGKKFMRKKSLTLHLYAHKNFKPYQCSICGKLFSNEPNLMRHLYIHSDEPEFQCANCHKKFFQKQGIAFHLKTCSSLETADQH